MQIMSRELARLLLILVIAFVISCSATQREGLQDQAQRASSQSRRGGWKPTRWIQTSTRFIKNRLLPFKDFKAKFHKHYSSPSEESLRHALYMDRVIKSAITFKKYVNKQLGTYNCLSSRSDSTLEERQEMIKKRPQRIATGDIEHNELTIMAQDTLGTSETNGYEAAAEYLTYWFAKRKPKPPQVYRTVDLRDTKCFLPPGDQGTCLSCASFVAIAQLEYLRCRETGKLEKLSEQFTIDCGHKFGMMGCSGTDVHSLFQFIAQVGLESGTKYPYKGTKRRCPCYNRITRGYNFDSEPRLKLKNEKLTGVKLAHWSTALEQKIPLHVGLKVNEDFEDYGGGVAGSCVYSNGAHGMLLIGEGREDGVDYWLLRNSYGPEWGVDGHYKISKQATGCFSDDGMGYYPVAFTKRPPGNSFVGELA